MYSAFPSLQWVWYAHIGNPFLNWTRIVSSFRNAGNAFLWIATLFTLYWCINNKNRLSLSLSCWKSMCIVASISNTGTSLFCLMFLGLHNLEDNANPLAGGQCFTVGVWPYFMYECGLWMNPSVLSSIRFAPIFPGSWPFTEKKLSIIGVASSSMKQVDTRKRQTAFSWLNHDYLWLISIGH